MTTTDMETQKGDTLIASLVHAIGLFSGLFGLVFVYLLSDDKFVERNARNALNWHIPLSALTVGIVLIGLAVSELAGVVLAVSAGVVTVSVALLASVRAYYGEAWPYPFVPQLL
ncbi:DUF4870 domain-containing protein [Halovenus sp. WSH3]|uniref:DUF4870 domain-containing protein n=1 Tax=Halovenus carboxidivorans TaxID=2692199 RepID=A0A6B0TBG4_9EURY|nr:DUF4870 domain-containing protein [Halovenus carboxidivorans]MXR52973.1 DUF4870 domain-containing protein [Halovenus carboxidivorans]